METLTHALAVGVANSAAQAAFLMIRPDQKGKWWQVRPGLKLGALAAFADLYRTAGAEAIYRTAIGDQIEERPFGSDLATQVAFEAFRKVFDVMLAHLDAVPVAVAPMPVPAAMAERTFDRVASGLEREEDLMQPARGNAE